MKLCFPRGGDLLAPRGGQFSRWCDDEKLGRYGRLVEQRRGGSGGSRSADRRREGGDDAVASEATCDCRLAEQ